MPQGLPPESRNEGLPSAGERSNPEVAARAKRLRIPKLEWPAWPPPLAVLVGNYRGESWVAVIVEHEIIEQIEEEQKGRSLKWVAELPANYGCSDPTMNICQTDPTR